MPEVRQEKLYIRISYTCDKCGKGEMRWTGDMPAAEHYSHRCEACGYVTELRGRHPRSTFPDYVQTPYEPLVGGQGPAATQVQPESATHDKGSGVT